jgi:hypothetical protein
MKGIHRLLLPVVVAVIAAFISPASSLMAQEEERVPGPLVGIGEDIWRAQPQCWACHGNLANGRNEDPRSPQGANLRESLMDVETLALVIRCGLPGTPMPYFGGTNAYAGNNPCFGTTAVAMGDQLPPQGAANYNARQIDALAQFIYYQFVGKGPATREECLAFYGANASSCSRWPTQAEVDAAAPAAPAGGG